MANDRPGPGPVYPLNLHSPKFLFEELAADGHGRASVAHCYSRTRSKRRSRSKLLGELGSQDRQNATSKLLGLAQQEQAEEGETWRRDWPMTGLEAGWLHWPANRGRPCIVAGEEEEEQERKSVEQALLIFPGSGILRDFLPLPVAHRGPWRTWPVGSREAHEAKISLLVSGCSGNRPAMFPVSLLFSKNVYKQQLCFCLSCAMPVLPLTGGFPGCCCFLLAVKANDPSSIIVMSISETPAFPPTTARSCLPHQRLGRTALLALLLSPWRGGYCIKSGGSGWST